MRKVGTVIATLGLSVSMGACGDSSGGSKPVPFTATAPDYKLSVFVVAPTSTMKPDSIVLMGTSIYIGYQNAGDVKDGSNPALTNSVVQYDLKANLLKTFTVPGHVDGLLARSDTNELWAMANEDGNPELTIINLASGAQKTYQPTVNPTLHGGGFDDMQLINGMVYVSASNPTTSCPAIQPLAPSVVSLTLNANGTTFDVAPVLDGNAQALDITPSVGGSPNPTFNTMVPLCLTDPDSEATDPNGNLVLDSQADGKLVFIKNPGPSQTVSVLILTLFNDKDGPTTPVDDTRWVPAPGPSGVTFMLFTDANNTTYRVDGDFAEGTPYSCGQGQVMQLDTTTGHLTPVVVGIGMLMVHPVPGDPAGRRVLPAAECHDHERSLQPLPNAKATVRQQAMIADRDAQLAEEIGAAHAL